MLHQLAQGFPQGHTIENRVRSEVGSSGVALPHQSTAPFDNCRSHVVVIPRDEANGRLRVLVVVRSTAFQNACSFDRSGEAKAEPGGLHGIPDARLTGKFHQLPNCHLVIPIGSAALML